MFVLPKRERDYFAVYSKLGRHVCNVLAVGRTDAVRIARAHGLASARKGVLIGRDGYCEALRRACPQLAVNR